MADEFLRLHQSECIGGSEDRHSIIKGKGGRHGIHRHRAAAGILAWPHRAMGHATGCGGRSIGRIHVRSGGVEITRNETRHRRALGAKKEKKAQKNPSEKDQISFCLGV